MEEMREELEEHMEITMRLTQQHKGMLRRSYLEMENNALGKVQAERKAVREKEELEGQNRPGVEVQMRM